MSYKVKETYHTIQGEGGQTGRSAVFCRFAGCNLWSGQEPDRARAICDFCDTNFVGTDGEGGGCFQDAATLAGHIARLWPTPSPEFAYVVFTGGEPLLQLDEALVLACKERGFKLAVETNGSMPPPPGIDWVCVSPKQKPAELLVRNGQELKLVFPQKKLAPAEFEDLDFELFFLQPMDGPDREDNTRKAVAYCLQHPKWRLSLQTHKIIGID